MPCRAGVRAPLVWAEREGAVRARLSCRQARPPPTPPRDHDDDVSLVEACRKLNEVIGLKGVSRWGRWDPRTPDSQFGHRGQRVGAPQGPQA